MDNTKGSNKNRPKGKAVCCSFCGKEIDLSTPAVQGADGTVLCMDCALQAGQYFEQVRKELDKQNGKTAQQEELPLKKPQEIKAFLDQYVVGQDSAKRILSVAVYNHYKRLNYLQHAKEDETEIEKSNIVMVGPTGTGKTLLARSIARLLQVPFCIADATVLTEAGYVGEDVETILSRLLQAADYDVKQAERGIVFIDEIDKIGRKSSNPSITRDVSGEGVQQALLKLVEGTESMVPLKGGRKHPNADMVKMDTRNILFIAGGSFEGIERNISSRLNMKAVGFRKEEDRVTAQDENLLQYVSPQDLRSYGLIPELVGRMPVIAHLDELDREALLNILTEPKNALIRQYKQLFKIDGIELAFESGLYEFVVDKAMEYKMGARGLRSIMEHLMNDLMYVLPGERPPHYTVTLEYAKNHLGKGVFEQLKNS